MYPSDVRAAVAGAVRVCGWSRVERGRTHFGVAESSRHCLAGKPKVQKWFNSGSCPIPGRPSVVVVDLSSLHPHPVQRYHPLYLATVSSIRFHDLRLQCFSPPLGIDRWCSNSFHTMSASLSRSLRPIARIRPAAAAVRSPLTPPARGMSTEPPPRHGVIIVNPEYVNPEYPGQMKARLNRMRVAAAAHH